MACSKRRDHRDTQRAAECSNIQPHLSSTSRKTLYEMHQCRVVCAAALLIVLPLLIQAQNPPVDISFTVAMPRPHTHLLEVDVAIKRTAEGPQQEQLIMPVWTPGSYLVREFARHVQDFAAKDSSGRPLQWEKTNKDTWRVTTGGAREWQATYSVYANELSVRTNQLNSDHAFWNNAALLMYLNGFLQAP